MKTSGVQTATGVALWVADLVSIGLIGHGHSEPLMRQAAVVPPAPEMVYPAGNWPDAQDLSEYDVSQNSPGNLTAQS